MQKLTFHRPDDWHLHLRDGAILQAVLPYTARVFGRAIIMPNLKPPVTTVAAAKSYRRRIMAALPPNSTFRPLTTCYLSDSLQPQEIKAGVEAGIFTAAKLYPAGATTNSEHGVTAIRNIWPLLETMQKLGLPLLLHGEVVDPEVDIFDREAVFIERVLQPLLLDFPGLKVVFEHITTQDAVEFTLSQGARVGATITPHHLMINRNAIFQGGIRPHLYCLPIAKRERHRLALQKAAVSGSSQFFLGTDSAPHLTVDKESNCGCAGIFNSPTALPCVAQVFEQAQALDKLEAFVSLNGAHFYGLPVNQDYITLERAAPTLPAEIEVAELPAAKIRVFQPPEPLHWRAASNL